MTNDLYTSQGENLPQTPWNCYPRPQMRRQRWQNLNGNWDFAVKQTQDFPATYDRTIRVPFCPESLLSGLKQSITPGSYLFYRKVFTLPQDWTDSRVLLHIGAADQIADIYVNQKRLCHHVGGYHSFTVDITPALSKENCLEIRVLDDLRSKVLPYGKQSLRRGGMWYTPVSGIWQSVWLEPVPENYIQNLDITVTGESATISVDPAMEGTVVVQGQTYPLIQGRATVKPQNMHLWSPEDPYLYDFSVQTEQDRVESYFALRFIETKTVRGVLRLCLNGKPYFFNGLLDQGYWSDGIYTPAEESCFDQDILAMKRLGFNTLRKHIKVEPEAFYYACDRLGMVVFQDMVNNGDYRFFRDTALPTIGFQKLPDKHMHRDEQTRQAFYAGMEQTVKQLKNHPCIVYWTIFNEGWGQFDSDSAYERLRQLDDSRIIDATSGWFRQKRTDVDSRHLYFGSWNVLQPGKKPLVLSEFGGYCYGEPGHLFDPQKAYGYKACKTKAQFNQAVVQLYREKLLPAVKRGVCAAICTQVSDVEEEINGFLTYDRRVCKADAEAMQAIAKMLSQAVGEEAGG